MWVNEREEEELMFDWGDKNIEQYIPRKQESYSVSKRMKNMFVLTPWCSKKSFLIQLLKFLLFSIKILVNTGSLSDINGYEWGNWQLIWEQ